MNFGSYTNLTDLFNAIQSSFDKRQKSKSFKKAEWEALTTAQKAVYDGWAIDLTDDYDVGAKIDDTTPASNKVFSSQKVDSTYAKKTALPVWTSVSALTGATSCTITNDAISSSSVLEPFFENTSNTDPIILVSGVSNHTATLTFNALAEDTTIYLRVTNL